MIRKLTKDDYRVSMWSGGTTAQLAIYPETEEYADRNFLWRISSATVDLPESDYTALPDYDRFITPLNGQMILTHDGGSETDVKPLTIHEFDGAAATHCVGMCTDFNLMLRKEKAQGFMQAVTLDSENGILIEPLTKEQTMLFYVVSGTAFLKDEDDVIELCAGESVLITDEEYEYLLESDDSAVVIAAGAEV